mmetsp:Transcript_12915/g.31477  ORF Transcript_12915/g.31477 Transcript_12915/m.31477 type:complete len:289 (-) Transcript_12915:1111-1977(-)
MLAMPRILANQHVLPQTERQHGLPEPHAPLKIELLAHVKPTADCHGGVERTMFSRACDVIRKNYGTHRVSHSHQYLPPFAPRIIGVQRNQSPPNGPRGDVDVPRPRTVKHVPPHDTRVHHAPCDHNDNSAPLRPPPFHEVLDVLLVTSAVEAMEDEVHRHFWVVNEHSLFSRAFVVAAAAAVVVVVVVSFRVRERNVQRQILSVVTVPGPHPNVLLILDPVHHERYPRALISVHQVGSRSIFDGVRAGGFGPMGDDGGYERIGGGEVHALQDGGQINSGVRHAIERIV